MKTLKTLLFLFIMSVVITANAQFKFGVGGGLNFASLSGDDSDGFKSATGFNAGIMTEIKLPAVVGFEADVLFSTKGATFNFLSLSEDLKLSYMDVPVVIKFYTVKVLSLQVGAQYSMLMGADFAGSDVKDNLKSSDLSAVIGFGVDVSKLHFSLRYNYGLSTIDDTGADLKNNVLMLTAGFWIKK